MKDGKNNKKIYYSNDRVNVGKYYSTDFGGISSKFGYKGLELSVLFNYMYGHHIYNNDRANVENPAYVISNVSHDLLTEWQQPGDITNIPSPFSNFELGTTRFLEKGDFMRLRNVMLSYQ